MFYFSTNSKGGISRSTFLLQELAQEAASLRKGGSRGRNLRREGGEWCRDREWRLTPRRSAVSSISFVTMTSAMIVASIVLSLWRQMAMRESVWFLGFSPVSKRKKDVPRGVRIVFCSSFVGVFFFIYFM